MGVGRSGGGGWFVHYMSCICSHMFVLFLSSVYIYNPLLYYISFLILLEFSCFILRGFFFISL